MLRFSTSFFCDRFRSTTCSVLVTRKLKTLTEVVDKDTRECFISSGNEHEKGIFFLNMNRPAKKNALSKQFLDQFIQCLDFLKSTKDVRAVILQSRVDKTFCAGADLKERSSLSPEQVVSFVNLLRSTFNELNNLPMPTIAAIDGVALGGGLEMALACDFRIAGENAKLGLPETKLGIFPGAGGTQRLPRLVGLSNAKLLIYTGRILDMQMAEDIGLVHEAVPNASVKAIELAKEIIPQGPIAMRLAKKALDYGSELDLASGLEFEQACYAQLMPTEDRLEGLRAFAEKRKPLFKGK
ncbi:hypothetical protein HMI54_003231 [Coelomomyces lativittatus]|nr:hypothetical protein HMI54_003231 [Coelomomyces lativittatus]KAJ1511039.1 hypothetical protein HMI56_005900 [Coelomomyces lativittatus]